VLLAIDTSTEFASVALWSDGAVQAEETWRSNRHHTRELMPTVDALLRRVAGSAHRAETTREPAAIVDAVAVAIGPGSYSGLRVGVSAAKGLALALDRPLVGVSTLAVQAYGCFVAAGPIWAVLPGGGRELAIASYRRAGDRWLELTPPRLATADQLLDELARSAEAAPTVCGELPPALDALIRERLRDRVVIAPAALRVRRAGWLAALAAERLARGERDDIARLEPIYLRRPSITPPAGQ
jgi:tRNA threonylcarbamoyladenosine biosynthesis protein TsaB